MSSSEIAIKDARCGPETHVVIDILKLRYEWSNYKHLRERNEAAGINKEIIDKVGPATNRILVTPAPLSRPCQPSYSRLSLATARPLSWSAPRSPS